VAGFGRMLLVGVAVAVGLGTVPMRAQTALEDPKNAPKIFANTCSACHKSPQGLAKSGGTASFLRQHYTTGPEMSAAMAAYLAAAGSAPPSKKSEKQKDAAAPAGAKTTAQKQGTATKQAKAPGNEPAKQAPTRPLELPPVAQPPAAAQPGPASSTAALNAPGSPAHTPEPGAAPAVTLDLPLPPFPSEPPAELAQPPVFSSAPLP
jgi:hypothetical protein